MAALRATELDKIGGFKKGGLVVLPKYGVGRINGIHRVVRGDLKRVILYIQLLYTGKIIVIDAIDVASSGMRGLSNRDDVERALECLRQPATRRSTDLIERVRQLKKDLSSGQLMAIAKVVRDLYCADVSVKLSKIEQTLFRAALERMVNEIAVVKKGDRRVVAGQLFALLQEAR